MAQALLIELSGTDQIDSERADELTRSLLEEISQIDGVAAEQATSSRAPDGAKGIGETLTQILIPLGAAGALLPTIVGAVQAWLTKQPPQLTGKVKTKDLEIEFSGATTAEEIGALIEKLKA